MRNLCAVFAFALVVALAAPAARALEIQQVTSPGGITAWLVSDDLVPVIAMDVGWRGGAAADPDGKGGLANLVSGLLDEGAGDLDSQAFQRRLEDLAISMSFSAGYDSFRGALKTLSRNRDEAFDLFRLAIAEPRFDPDPVARLRAQIIARLERDEEDPQTVAFRAWRRQVFGDHPYARPTRGSLESVAALTRDDLVAFTERHLARDNLLIAVVGDITAEELKPLLDDTFGALPAKADLAKVADTTVDGAGETSIIRRPIPQSFAVFGQAGIDRQDPDFYAATLMMEVLGSGGFSSRLTEEVREKRGLAYSVWAGLNPDEHAHFIVGSVGTQNARLEDSLDIVRAEWRRMAEEGVTEQELEDAKEAVIGAYPLRLTSTDGIAGILLGIQFEELGIDYIDRRGEILRAVTPADVQRVAGELLDPAKLSVVVVGDPPAAAPETEGAPAQDG